MDDRLAADEPRGDGAADPTRVDRRSALKKAGVAAAVAGAVWASPSIDGLSIAPDYASAATAAVGPITFNWSSDGPGLAGGANHFHPITGPGYNVTQAGHPGPGNNTALQYTAPLPAIGPTAAAVLTLPAGSVADGGAFTGTVTFNNIDPPFNKCTVTGGNFDPVTPAFFGDLPGGALTIGPNPIPNNSPSFTIPFTMNARPGNAVRVNGVHVTIRCT